LTNDNNVTEGYDLVQKHFYTQELIYHSEALGNLEIEIVVDFTKQLSIDININEGFQFVAIVIPWMKGIL